MTPVTGPGGNSGVVVVVPAHQAAGQINAALASVVAQTVLPSEVVVVDDGSADATFEVAQRWKQILPLTVLRHDRSHGAAAARRTAISASQSPLLALLDADDVWLPDHLASLLENYASSECIVTADAYRWVPGKRLLRKTHRDLEPVPATDRQAEEVLRRNFVFIGSLFSRVAYEGAGGFRDGLAEDWDLWIRMVRRGAVVRTTDHATVLYRLSPTSTTSQPDVLDSYVEVLERALAEAESEREREVVASSLPRMRARRHLVRARAAVSRGDWTAVRAEAMDGPARMKAEALALRACPRLSLRLGRAVRRRYRD